MSWQVSNWYLIPYMDVFVQRMVEHGFDRYAARKTKRIMGAMVDVDDRDNGLGGFFANTIGMAELGFVFYIYAIMMTASILIFIIEIISKYVKIV